MQARASWLGSRSAFTLASAVIVLIGVVGPAVAQRGDSIPSQNYYRGIDELYRGDFRDAQRTFNRSLQGSVKTLSGGGTVLWIDSICYYTMLGETYYQWGQPEQALKQFTAACSLYLQYPRWMLRVQFNVPPVADSALARVAAPWGVSQRRTVPGKFQATANVSQGQIDNSRVVQQGGVVQSPQFWPVDVVEILRCTTLAIRRRNELLGPLGPHDEMSRKLALSFARGGAPPNHWAGAWVDVQRGLAHAGVGETEQALQYLDRGTLISGQFDHPLSCIALLEQGRLALAAGNVDAAAGLFAEAGYSAFVFGDPGVIDDSFRWGELCRFAANLPGINPGLQRALAWARRDNFDYIAGRINLLLAEEYMTAGDLKNAGVALAAGAALIRDGRTGVLGNFAGYLEAKLDYANHRDGAAAKFDAVLDGQRKISVPNFQIGLANAMFDAQTLPTRSAPSVYEILLSDPMTADVVLQPLESMAVMTTPHEDAFERWLISVLDRRNLAAALDVTDRTKRRRFHQSVPWGGRLAAVRDILTSPPDALTPELQQQQGELLTRFPTFAAVTADVHKLRGELSSAWLPALDDAAKGKVAKLWNEYVAAIDDREQQLAQIGLTRVPADYSFPPLLGEADLKKRLAPGQAVLVYHETVQGVFGLLYTAEGATYWNCGPSAKLSGLVAQFLRDLGNTDANREMSVEELASDQWQKSGAKLVEALFKDSSVSPGAIQELVVVPDGITWYVPFEALPIAAEDKTAPFVTIAKIRYAPTVGLAFSFEDAWRRVQRTGVVVGDLPPGDKPGARATAVAPLEAALESPLSLAPPSPAPSPAVASLLDALVVLDTIDAQGAEALDWSPLPIDRANARSSLDQWFAIPAAGPQRILLPGMRTLAERGGKAPRRRGASTVAPGDDLFYASCSLMYAGAETIMLSRWRVGGQSTLDLVREFAQEMPHVAAAEAWQRSVELAMEMPVDPVAELRVRAGKDPVELKAAHPFFWAGYLIVDSGWRPPEPEPDPAAVPPADPGATPPAGVADPAGAPPAGNPPPVPGVPPAGEQARPSSSPAPDEEEPAATSTATRDAAAKRAGAPPAPAPKQDAAPRAK